MGWVILFRHVKQIVYICTMTITEANRAIKKTGLKKSFIAASIGIEPNYFARFFTSGPSRRKMPKGLDARLSAFLEQYK